MIRYSLFIALFLMLQACGGEEKVELKTAKQKYSYVLGVEIAKPFITEAPFNKMDKEKLKIQNEISELQKKKVKS